MTETKHLGISLEEFRTQVTQAAREPLLARIAEIEEINTQLCEQADVAANAYSDLQAQLVKEAARTAEEKLRADQMSKQHDMQAKMRQEAARKLAYHTAASQGVDGFSSSSIQPNIDMLNIHIEPAELIRVVCSAGSAVTIKEDCSLFVEDGADLQEAAEAIVTATFQIIKSSSLIFNDLTSFIQLGNSRGAVLSVNIDGEVEASAEWPQETVEFAKMIGKSMLNRISNTPEKQAIEAMELALSSYGTQLLSYPPQDAWVARDVSYKLRAAIAALAAQAKQGGV